MAAKARDKAHLHGILPEEFEYFNDIFELEARSFEGYKPHDKRIDYDSFVKIFSMTGYEPNQRQTQEYE